MDLNPGSGPWGAPHLGVGRILNPGSLEAATEATSPPPASGDLKHITDDPKQPGDTYQTYQREREIYIYNMIYQRYGPGLIYHRPTGYIYIYIFIHETCSQRSASIPKIGQPECQES